MKGEEFVQYLMDMARLPKSLSGGMRCLRVYSIDCLASLQFIWSVKSGKRIGPFPVGMLSRLECLTPFLNKLGIAQNKLDR